MTIVPSKFERAALVPSSQIVASISTANLELEPRLNIPAGSFIKLEVPKWNPNAATPESTFS